MTDSEAIELIVSDNLKGFREDLSSEENFMIEESKEFDTEAGAQAFCAGLGYGEDERAPPSIYPLRSCEPCDRPYIEAIESLI